MGANPVVTIHERVVGERLSGRTGKPVLRGIVRKRAGQELGGPALCIAFHRPPTVLPGPVEVHSLIGRHLHRSVIGVVAVGHELFGLTSQRGCAAFQCRFHLPVVDGIGRRLDVHHHPVLRVGKQLQVVTGDGATFAVAHHVRLGIAAGGACHEPVALMFLRLLQALDFAHRRFQPTDSLPCGTSLRRRPPARAFLFFFRLRVQPAHLLARQLQVRRQLLFAPEAVAARIRLDLRPVQCYPFQRDQPLGAHHAQHLHEQIVQRRFMIGTEAGQRPMTDRLQAAQPLATRFVLALSRQLTCRTHSTAVRVNPQADQQLRVGVLPPGAPFHRLDLRVIKAQIQAADQLPDQACAMILVDELFHIDAAQHQLLSVDRGKSRFRWHAVVVHIRSLPRLANFAMALLGRKTISSQLPDGTFTSFRD